MPVITDPTGPPRSRPDHQGPDHRRIGTDDWAADTDPVGDTDLVGDRDVLDAAGIDAMRTPGALHAMEHAAIGLLPLFTICDRWDVGGVSISWHDDVGAAAVFIHDGYPGGAGIAELGFDAADRHLAATLDVIEGCACQDGCPSCVQSPKCGNGNHPLDKDGAVAVLHIVLDAMAPARAVAGLGR